MLAVLSCFSFNKYAISGKLDQTSLFYEIITKNKKKIYISSVKIFGMA